MTWREAFFRQAENDFALFHEFNRSKPMKPACQQVHYLQMATEKLAKAIKCRWLPKKAQPPTHHVGFVETLRLITNRDRELRRRLKYGVDCNRFSEYITSLLPLAQAIEDLAPEGKRQKPNPEYPWNMGGNVICPLDYPFDKILGTPAHRGKLPILEKLIGELIQIGRQQT
jgi:hypothetical protein